MLPQNNPLKYSADGPNQFAPQVDGAGGQSVAAVVVTVLFLFVFMLDILLSLNTCRKRNKKQNLPISASTANVTHDNASRDTILKINAKTFLLTLLLFAFAWVFIIEE